MSLTMRMKRSLASRLLKNDTMYLRKSICVARKKISVTKKSVTSTTAGVTKATSGVTMANCDDSTATVFSGEGNSTSCNSRNAANGRSNT